MCTRYSGSASIMRDDNKALQPVQSLASPSGGAGDDSLEHPAPGRLATIGWGLAGFVVGAVFWHFIGFWSFVNDIVLKGRPDDGRIIAQTGYDCTEVSRDRASGELQFGACPLHAPLMAEIGVRGREDSDHVMRLKKLESPRWTVLVNQDSEEAEAPR